MKCKIIFTFKNGRESMPKSSFRYVARIVVGKTEEECIKNADERLNNPLYKYYKTQFYHKATKRFEEFPEVK